VLAVPLSSCQLGSLRTQSSLVFNTVPWTPPSHLSSQALSLELSLRYACHWHASHPSLCQLLCLGLHLLQ